MCEAVGVIGLGNIGGRVTDVLLEDFDVVAFDIDDARLQALADQGGTAVDSARSRGMSGGRVALFVQRRRHGSNCFR